MRLSKIFHFSICIFMMLIFSHVHAQSVQLDIQQTICEFVECANDGNGEFVKGDISIHGVLHFNADGDITKAHFHPQGGSMYGEITGTRFQATGVTTDVFLASNSAQTGTIVNRFHLVGQGGIQFIFYCTGHFTVNANGEVTADFFNEKFECKS